jgi:hypothetical protein
MLEAPAPTRRLFQSPVQHQNENEKRKNAQFIVRKNSDDRTEKPMTSPKL